MKISEKYSENTISSWKSIRPNFCLNQTSNTPRSFIDRNPLSEEEVKGLWI